jgi:hypothetical protein
MNYSIVKRAWAKSLVLISLLTAVAFTSKAGGDVFEIYLNNTLLVRQMMWKPLDIKNLALTNANINDRLVIYFNHCGTTGKGRNITMKDEKGNVIKKWNFADATDAKGPMVIPVKEILQLEKSNHQLNMVYTCKEYPRGQLLSSFNPTSKSTTYNDTQNKEALIVTAGIAGLLLISLAKIRA